jgi:hypothetical protein
MSAPCPSLSGLVRVVAGFVASAPFGMHEPPLPRIVVLPERVRETRVRQIVASAGRGATSASALVTGS